MKRNWTLDQSSLRIFLPPSSSTLGPAVPSELRAASSTVTRLSWACQDTSLPLLVGRFCTKCWSHSVRFMVAPVAPVLEAQPLPVEAKPALSVATTRIYSNTAGCDGSFEPGWPGKAAGEHRAVCLSGLSPSVPTPPMPPPNSHQKVEKKNQDVFHCPLLCVLINNLQ